MEGWKKIGKALLFPHMAVLWGLLPVAIGLLVYSMVFLNEKNPVSIASYVLSAYTLTVWCCRIPKAVSFFRNFKNTNRYVQRWLGDIRLRMQVSLFGGFAWNAVYAVFQLCLGIYHHSFWFCSLAGYYFLLSLMRCSLARYTRTHKPGEDMTAELKRYRYCGIVFLFINLALALIVFFMVYWNRTFRHHQITTIAMAAYTFFSFVMAVINLVKYRKIGSPVFSASKAISLAAACVSMLTLESTMLTVFGEETTDVLTRRIFLGATGGVISVLIIGMAVYMIVHAGKQLKKSKACRNNC